MGFLVLLFLPPILIISFIAFLLKDLKRAKKILLFIWECLMFTFLLIALSAGLAFFYYNFTHFIPLQFTVVNSAFVAVVLLTMRKRIKKQSNLSKLKYILPTTFWIFVIFILIRILTPISIYLFL